MDALVKSTFVIALVAVLGLSAQQVDDQLFAAVDRRSAQPVEEFVQLHKQARQASKQHSRQSPRTETTPKGNKAKKGESRSKAVDLGAVGAFGLPQGEHADQH